MIERIKQPEVQKFIKDHSQHDPFLLSLKQDIFPGLPIKEIARQIQARQKAKYKFPSWLDYEGIIYPPPLSVEQASSEKTAAYKSTLFQGQHFVDLTGGAGIDCLYFSKRFEKTIYVEKDQFLAEAARNNFRVMKMPIEVVQAGAGEFLASNNRYFDLIYLDPDRRKGKKEFRLQYSQPDVTLLMNDLLQQGKQVLIKASPWLDIDHALQDLGLVKEIWVLSIGRDCKEVLYLCEPNKTENPKINTIDLKEGLNIEFSFFKKEERLAEAGYASTLQFLYEPNPALMKAGPFNLLSDRFNLFKLHPNTHLYTSDSLESKFPGRIFKVREKLQSSKKGIKHLYGRYHVITRNFPLQADQLQKKLKIQEGDDGFLIATTDIDHGQLILNCELVFNVH